MIAYLFVPQRDDDISFSVTHKPLRFFALGVDLGFQVCSGSVLIEGVGPPAFEILVFDKISDKLKKTCSQALEHTLE